jgi:glycosyl transferase family 25
VTRALSGVAVVTTFYRLDEHDITRYLDNISWKSWRQTIETSVSSTLDPNIGRDADLPSKTWRQMKTIVLVISMPNSPRREEFSTRARESNVEWSYFDAVSGLDASLHYDEKATLINVGRNLTVGELGCYSSHYLSWHRLIQSDATQMIVLEDDTLVDWEYIAELMNFDLSKRSIDWLRLYAKIPSRYRMICRPTLDHRRHIVEFLNYAGGTQGYVISRSGASKFLAHCRIVGCAIDTEMDRFWVHGVRDLAIFPFPIVELSGPSTIGGERGFVPGTGKGSALPASIRRRQFANRAIHKLRKLVYPLLHPAKVI